MTRYAVIGDPVAHSKSPRIHQLFAEQTGEDVQYEAIQVRPDALAGFIDAFFASGGGGLNVTVPHKEAAFRLCSSFSPQGQLAQAVNTLLLNASGQLHGDNTDGRGIVTDITANHDIDISGKKVLVVGAGGAARGALPALINANPAQITLVNRTLDKVRAIQQDLSAVAELQVAEFAELEGQTFDLIINATSLSLSGQVPPLPTSIVSSTSCCYDMMYSDTDTAFIVWAKQVGAGCALDGLGMLVEQAAESFSLWRGVRPATAPVIAALRKR